MGQRLLVFGGTGFVGGHIAQRAYDAGWQVTAATSRAAPSPGPVASRPVDVGDPWAVRGAVEDLRPDVVVNAAALADVDRAEREPDLAWRVNAEGARNVAQACQDFGARCIYYSTDVVFDGTAQAYREDDPMGPINAYGKSKAEGERLTLATCPGAAIIRVSLVLGFPLGQGNAYLPKLRERLLAGQPAPSPADELRTPVDVHTAVAATLELASNDLAGRLHIGATQAVDRYTLAQRLASAMGLNPSLVLPHAVYPTGEGAVVRAERHKRGVLDVTRAQQVLATPMLSLDETIYRALKGMPL
jgi:dTDP-4-dehydrorhamnose reductase